MATDFNSKYSGEQVEELLDQVANGGTGGGGVATETDPIFSASPAASITEEKIAEWDNKVDKVNGKQLSTEDFTTALKNKLNGLSNYDDTTISQAVEKLRADLDALVSGDTTTAIKTFNEVIAFLDGIQDSQDLSSIIASIEQQIAGKMDSVTLANVATSGSYDDLTNKPTIPSAVTESTVSGWGFTKNTGTYSKPSAGIPKTDLASAIQTSLGKADSALQEIPSDVVRSNESGEVEFPRGMLVDNYMGMWYALPLADGADKEDADAILAWYSPSGDLVMQTGVLVDNNEGHRYALPYASEEDKAGADSVIASEAYVDDEIVKFDNVAVEPLWEELDKKQPTLESGVNIKTINGESILGSGDIVISGGGSSGGSSKEFVEVTPIQEPVGYYGNLTVVAPNNVYVFTKPIYALGVSMFTKSDSKGDEYSIMFTASVANVIISLPSSTYKIYWANGVVPMINSGDLCELSLVRIGNDVKAVLTTFKAV